jgi:hypothetical protein
MKKNTDVQIFFLLGAKIDLIRYLGSILPVSG